MAYGSVMFIVEDTPIIVVPTGADPDWVGAAFDRLVVDLWQMQTKTRC